MSQEPAAPTTEPIPISAGRPSWGDAFGVMKNSNFRHYAGSYAVLVTSLSMQRIMLAWSVLETSGDLTHVGAAIALQYLPMLVFGMSGGVVADRWNKRRVLIACQIAFLVLAAVVFVFAAVASLSLVVIYTVGVLIGVVQAFQLPASQGMVGEAVSNRDIPSAVSLMSSAFQAGQVVGPALGGVLLAHVGSEWAWGVNVIVVCGSLLLLLRVDKTKLWAYRRPVESRTTASAGIRYVLRKPAIGVVLLLILVISTCVYATPVFLTAFAEIEFRIGADGYGMLNSIMAFGAMTGAVLSAKRPAPTLGTILFCTVLLGVSQVVMGGVVVVVVFGVALFVRGATSLFTTTAANAYVQLRTNPLMRGRVMSFYGMMMNGGMALGNLLAGSLVERFGVRPVVMLTGVLPIVVACFIAIWVRKLDR